VKYLIAGFGSIGRRHFRNLLALGERDILFYRTGRSQLDNSEIADYIVETDLSAALAHKPHAVIVANPSSLHLDVAIPAAKAGCHLLLEKPISHSMERVDELEAAVVESGSRVLVGFQLRINPGLQKAEELLKAGALGKVVEAKAHWGEYLPDWHPWEKDFREGYSARADLGGGVVLTLCHPFDYLRWLLGEVRSVTGDVRATGELGIDVDDEAKVHLDFVSGAKAAVELSYLEKPGGHWLNIQCERGALNWDAATNALVETRNDGSQHSHHAPSDFNRNQLFLEQMRHFVSVVKDATEPACTLTDGRKALEIALAAHASSSTNQTPINL
jgi:predicted dehydrogenase